MTSFERFHPVLTPNFQLDWLTESPIKAVHALYTDRHTYQTADIPTAPGAILETVKSVSQTMQQVMRQNELTWGITQTNNNQLVGVIKILNLNRTPDAAKIAFIVKTPGILKEVLVRTIQFVKDHFKVSQLTITLTKEPANLIQVLKENNFHESVNSVWKLSLGQINGEN